MNKLAFITAYATRRQSKFGTPRPTEPIKAPEAEQLPLDDAMFEAQQTNDAKPSALEAIMRKHLGQNGY